MDKSKAMRNIFLYIAIIMACMFFLGFFTAKKVYASETDFNKNINAIRSFLTAKGIEETVIDDFIENNSIINTFLPDNPYVVLTYFDNNRFHITVDDDNIKCSYFYHIGSNTHYMQVKGQSTHMFQIEDGEIIQGTSQSSSAIKAVDGDLGKSLLLDDDYPSSKNTATIYYSSHDILFDNTWEDIGIYEDEVFFFKTTILYPIFRQIPITVMEQVVFLIPISLGLVVSLMGLRKALAWLSTMLKRA